MHLLAKTESRLFFYAINIKPINPDRIDFVQASYYTVYLQNPEMWVLLENFDSSFM